MKKNIPDAPYAYKKHSESKWHTFKTKKELIDSFFDLKDWNWIYKFEEKFDANDATKRVAESFEDGKECPVYITSDPEGDTLPFFRTKAAWQSYIAKDPYNIAKNSLADERTLEVCAKFLPLDDLKSLYAFFKDDNTSWSGKAIFGKEIKLRDRNKEHHWGEAPFTYKKHGESKWHTFKTKKELIDSFFDLKDWNWIYRFEEKFDANDATKRVAESFEDGKECPVYITSDPAGDTLPFFRTKAAWQSYIAKDPYNIAKNSLDDEKTLELCAKLLPLDDLKSLYAFFKNDNTSWSGKAIFGKEIKLRERKRETH